MRLVVSTLIACAACGLLAAHLFGSDPKRTADEHAPLDASADLPRGVEAVLAAHAFVLDEPFVHEWRAEQPLVGAGYLLVLAAEPELARTRQTYEPVLYVGDETAQRLYVEREGGRMLVLVPAPERADGSVALELGSTPIWFGTLELPERVDARRIASERALAERRGIGPAPRARELAPAGARDVIHVRSRAELEPYVEALAERFSVR